METSLGINQAVISLEPTPLTSIENRTDSPSSEDIKPNIINRGCQVQRSKSGDGRYSVSSTSFKNNFYAIHHSFKTLNENNEPNQQQQQQQQQQEKSATAILPSSSPSSSPFSTAATTKKTMATVTPLLLPVPTTTTATTTKPTASILISASASVSTSPSWSAINTPPSDITTNQISRKRVTPDPTTETRTSEITGAVSPSPTTTIVESNDNSSNNNNHNNNNSNNKRKKLRQLIKHRKTIDSHSSANSNTSQEYCLFKSASSIWPGSTHSLGDFSHQNITDLSQLLKIRLCQAKFKMMATLDQENDLFDFLNDEYLPPQPKIRRTSHLPTHHHQSTMSVVGNGKNLFRRYNKKHQGQGQELQQQQHQRSDGNSNNNQSSSATATTPSLSSKENSNLDGKRQKQGSQSGKTKRISKRRSVACDVPSVLLSDGTRIYLCEPCGKKYKNRNGLTYHLERCKNKTKKDDSNSNNDNDTNNKLNCICPQSNQQQLQLPDSPLIQCEKCRSLLHTECMGLAADDASHDDFICPHCKVDPKQDEENTQKTVSTIVSKPSPLMDEHSDAPLADDEGGSPEDASTQNDYIHDNNNDIISNTNNNYNDISTANNNEDPNSTLHVWDDFSFSSALDKVIEPWSMLSEEEPFSNYDSTADIPSQWNMNNILNQPPSLLFSDATMSSTLEDDSAMLSSELTPVPISELSPPATTTALVSDPSTTIINNNNSSNNNNNTSSNSNSVNTPVQHSDGLWFQFANFDDDYHCE